MAPAAPGNFAIRFVEGVDGTVLASVPLRVIQARASLEVPETAMAGSPVTVRYTPAQAGSGSFITAVAPDAEPGAYTSDIKVDGGEGSLRPPGTPGRLELRFVLGGPGGGEVIARRPISLTQAVATLAASDVVAAGEAVTIRYNRPARGWGFRHHRRARRRGRTPQRLVRRRRRGGHDHRARHARHLRDPLRLGGAGDEHPIIARRTLTMR
jgi:hypothetical protein